MNITIAIHYIHNDNKVLRRGSFPVNTVNYMKDEKGEAARVAYDFINYIRKESSPRIIVENVFYNDNDITEYMRQVIKGVE